MEQTVFDKILNTGEADLLIADSGSVEQMAMVVRMLEVMGELAAAVQYDDKCQAADAIGWCVVTLTILAAQLKLNVVQCIPEPYNGIEGDKSRTLAKQFKKLPVEIEAMQWIGKNTIEVFDWIFINDPTQFVNEIAHSFERELLIHTLGGVMKARVNDWIIRGVNGEFYPCKPDIFAKTYAAVEFHD